MLKKIILLFSAVSCIGNAVKAQKCATDEMHRFFKENNPQIAIYEAQLEQDIKRAMTSMDLKKLMRTTGTLDSTYNSDTAILNIPVVVHVIHDYGAEYITDNSIYQLIDEMNEFFAAKNADLSSVITPFKQYIGNARIHFTLATKDPIGNPTHGIVRKRSVLTYGGDELAKFEPWATDAYYNMYIENVIGRTVSNGIVLAYATYPSSGAANPYADGIICAAPYIHAGGYTIQHETGHFFNLLHTFGNTNNAGVVCGDDEVDDTPPTKGHFSTCPLYDTACAQGYIKNNINYPDTANTQNVMDYSSCTNMFTQGQVVRMRAALRSSVAQRDQLSTAFNMERTGALDPVPDLPPVADFSMSRIPVTATGAERLPADKVFGCANSFSFQFTDRSWNDTIESRNWTFSNGAQNATANTAVVNNKFSEPGWATVSLTVSGNNGSGSNTVTRQAVYVADTNGVNAEGYFQEFNDVNENAKWPVFNYYNNSYKWEVVNNAGYTDQSAICYKNFDNRTAPYTSEISATPKGDYDDFFSIGFDLSGSQFDNYCTLNFMTAGAFKTTNPAEMKDSLEVWYSTDCGDKWTRFLILDKGNLANNGTISSNFVPGWSGQWKLQSLALPAAARSAHTFFRFRFKPGAVASASAMLGTGNNFYIDRINIGTYPAGVNNVLLDEKGIAVVPNPTNGNAKLQIKSGKGIAQIQVTDITGKAVYRTQHALGGIFTEVEIPASDIAAKGIYLVQVYSEDKMYTEKLVVY